MGVGEGQGCIYTMGMAKATNQSSFAFSESRFTGIPLEMMDRDSPSVEMIFF